MPRRSRGHGFYHVKGGRSKTARGGRGNRGRGSVTPSLSQQAGEPDNSESPSPSSLPPPSPSPEPRLLSPECWSVSSVDLSLDESVGSNSSSVFRAALSPAPVEGSAEPFNVVDETLRLIRSVLPAHWGAFKSVNGFHVFQASNSEDIAIQRNIFAFFSGAFRISVHRKPISLEVHDQLCKGSSVVVLTEASYRAFVDQILPIILLVRNYDICAGADDLKCKKLWPSDNTGEIDHNLFDETRYQTTFRNHDCCMLVPTRVWRCSNCYKSQKNMRSRLESHQDVQVKPNTRNDFLDDEQLRLKLQQETEEKRNLKRKNDYLHKKVAALIEAEGVRINQEDSDHFIEILKDSRLTPAQQLFIHQQHKLSQCKGSTGMRWHPAMIRFALLLKSTCTSAYEAVQKSGFIKLPSERTLFDYSHVMPPQTGVFLDRVSIVSDIVIAFNEEHKKFHTLLFDEIHISQKLVYSNSDGNIVGYVKLSDAAAELQALSDSLESSEKATQPAVATKMLVYMIKGVTNGVKEVIAAFPVAALGKEDLFGYTWEVISACERSGIKTIALVSDGSSVNRAFYQMHTPVTVHRRGVVFDTINMCDPNRVLYFISDPPHLLKTIRNCFAKSGFSKKCTRLLSKGNENIVWKTIEKLYIEDMELTVRRSYKLNEQSVYLNSYSCMKVAYAAHVLSNTVGCDLKDRNWPGTKETVNFILKTNNFYDNLNGAHTQQSVKTGNKRLAAYTSIDDWRFQELKEYEEYLLGWEEEVQSLSVSSSEKSKRLLSRQTMDGVYITVNGFIGAIKYLLSETGARFINGRIFNQDPLEQYFSKQRASLGGSHNPTVTSFMTSDQRIAVHRDMNVKKRSGNTEAFQTDMILSDVPLLKRKKT